MDVAYSHGITHMNVRTPCGSIIIISILSRRTAYLAIKKSLTLEWRRHIIPYLQPWNLNDFTVVGFQPETGFHVVFKTRR